MVFSMRLFLVVSYLLIFCSVSFGSYYPLPLPGTTNTIMQSNGTKWVNNGTVVVSGTWTPTVGAATNSDSQSITDAYYIRVGSVISFSVVLLFDATTASTASTIGITPPVASNFTVAADVAGTCGTTGGGDTLTRGAWQADAANDRLSFSFVPSTNSNNTYYCSGSYRVK